jgi:hypothetical protein
VSSSGHGNSLASALQSVGAAVQGVIEQQRTGVRQIYALAQKDLLPKPMAMWEVALQSVLSQGLVLAVDAVMLHLGAGLASAARDALEARGIGGAKQAASAVTAATLKLHKSVRSSIGSSVARNVVGGIHSSAATAPVDVLIREAFFQSQLLALTTSETDAITELDNNEGDFAALEQEQAGLGFVALEAYRNHLACNALTAAEIQSQKTLGMWLDVMAQQKLGTHVPDDWEHASHGVELQHEVAVTAKADLQLVRHQLTGGVLDLEVVWDYDHEESPILQAKSARLNGLHPDLKALLTTAPLGEFQVPIIVHGSVLSQSEEGDDLTSELAIARNGGGAIFVAANPGKKGDRMLDALGEGDRIAGAARLFEHVDQRTLSKVE